MFLSHISRRRYYRILRLTSLQIFKPFLNAFCLWVDKNGYDIFGHYIHIQSRWQWRWRKGIEYVLSVQMIFISSNNTSKSLSRVHSRYVFFSVLRTMSYGHIGELESEILPWQANNHPEHYQGLLGGRGNRYGWITNSVCTICYMLPYQLQSTFMSHFY